MGGEGSISHAIISLKANLSLLKRRRLKAKEDVYGVASKTKLNLKKSTLKDMMLIRHKIALQKKKDRIIVLSAILGTALIFLFGYLLIT